MRKLVLVAVSLVLLGSSLAKADDSKDFFNGTSTEGWEGMMKFWSVKDGAIVGSTLPDGINFNTFLCSKKTYKDFELSFDVHLKGGIGNSGVQIRSKIFGPDRFAVAGPQCDMGQVYWGSLYGEHFGGKKPLEGGMMQAAPPELVKKVLKKDDFNQYSIRCVGKHVTIKLNGETTVDKDFDNLPEEGIIAFQLHGGAGMQVTFKNIKFSEVKAK